MALRISSTIATSLAAIVSMQGAALAAELPQIKISAENAVPECVTPGRLMSYVKSRNDKLDAKFEEVATQYMRHGEELGLRWDYAFFQMMLETNTLKYTGDVNVKQNNFAGLGATGNGAKGESFKSVADGVRAHLQHVQMYSGEKVESPVAERTKNIQEWGVLTSWQKTIKGPMTYTQLAKQWAPTSRGYPKDVETLAGLFFNGACKGDDPHPEMIADARKGREQAGKTDAAAVAASGKGAEIAKRAIDEARAEGASRSSLGATSLAKEAEAPKGQSLAAAMPDLKILNAAPAVTETATPAVQDSAPQKVEQKVEASKPPAVEAAASPESDARIETAALAAPALGQPENTAAEPKKDPGCHVFTASYGGSKAIIIKAIADAKTNYTVLDVNEGAEKREAEAYIGAYAKGGETVGEFANQDKALEKAFELCPEG